MAKNNSEEINFQYYFEGVKQKKISWDFFFNFMQDLSYPDIDRLSNLNKILLKELTMNYSDEDKLKHINEILLIQFKNYIHRENTFETTENDYYENLQKSNHGQILNEEILKEVPKDTSKNAILKGHKDYKCESCGKSFTRRQSLKKHVHAIHEGHKNHKCPSCGKCFSQAENLKTHFNTVHEGHKYFKCKSCNKSFSSAGYLKRHIYKIHSKFFWSEINHEG